MAERLCERIVNGRADSRMDLARLFAFENTERDLEVHRNERNAEPCGALVGFTLIVSMEEKAWEVSQFLC